MKIGQRSLLGYLPAQVIKCVLDGTISQKPRYPLEIPLNTVSLFADISGFTKLSEKFSKKGRTGPEFLAFCLNRYMELLINIIGKNGGDIFKFAGDALLVIWPSSEKNDLEESCRRAFQCALTIQSKLNHLDMGSGNPLSVKVGIGVGECKIFFVGGTFNRSEYLIVGSAMKQACSSECHATTGGQIIISEKVYNQIHKYYKFVQCEKDNEHSDTDDMNYYLYVPNPKIKNQKLQVRADAFLMRTKFNQEKLGENINILRTFVPAAIINYLDIEMESWCKEIRLLTIMFIKLSLDLKDTETKEGREKIQNVVSTVQRCVYRTRGSLNKFLMDDKGSVMLCCWGLPPFSSSDDPVRAVLSGNSVLEELKQKFSVKAMIGITTGSCFTGVCGGLGGRREYSLLGEVVNLSARFMQSAIKIYELSPNNNEFSGQVGKKSLFLCEKTKNLIQNKIFCEFRINRGLKGFSISFDHFSPIDEKNNKKMSMELIHQLIKTRRNNNVGNSDSLIELDNNFKGIGIEEEKKIIQDKYNLLIETGQSQAILITGIIGSGKSLLVRTEVQSIIRKGDNSFLKNLDKIIFISNQNPITRTINMNGFQSTFRKIFNSLLNVNNPERKKYQVGKSLFVEGDLIFNLIYSTDNFKNIHYIEEILNYDLSPHYSIIKSKQKDTFNEIKELEKPGDPFFFVRNYESNKTQISKFFLNIISKYQKHILKDKPLILIVEDSQDLDSISVEFIRQFLFSIQSESNKKIFMLCTFQSLICGLKDLEKEKFARINSTLEEAFALSGTIIKMKPFLNHNYISEIIKTNITTMPKEEIREASEEDPLKPNELYENIHIDDVPTDVINAILPLSFKGNPLFIIEICQSLVNQGLLILKNKTSLLLSDELKKMIIFKDYSKMQIPFIMEKVLGNIIDSLKCTEIIILKHAAAIGNIFDIDILSDIISFPSITFDDLLDMLKNFENLGLIEILYDLKPKHLVAMFTIPLLREVLYQRMLVEQKTDIHSKIARKMEFSKFSYMPKDIEQEVLKNHLETSEKTIMNHLEYNDIAEEELSNSNLSNQKILTTKDLIEKLKIIDLKITSSYPTLKKQYMPMLMSSEIVKKDEHGGKEEIRFAVLTNNKFCYYYYQQNYYDNNEPLASFFLKNIYQISILDKESSFETKKYYLEIKVSSWFKKDIEKDDRTFIIGFNSKEELSKWEIALHFLRIKNMYDEFTSNFGMIQLPLNRQYMEGKKYKRKLLIKPRESITKQLSSFHLPNSIGRNKNFIRKKTISNVNINLITEQEKIEVDKKNLGIVNENGKNIFINGFGLFLGKIQECIKNQKLELEFTPNHLVDCKTNINFKKFSKDYEQDSYGS